MNGHFKLGDLSPRTYFFSIAFVLGLLFALVSDTEGEHFWVVLLRWQFQSLIPMVLLIQSHICMSRFKWICDLKNGWIRLLVSGILGATLFTPLGLALDLSLGSEDRPRVLWMMLFDEWVNVVPPVTLCWLAINTPWQNGYFIAQNVPAQSSDKNEPTGNKSPSFLDLIPEDKQGDLIYMKAELHYVQVVTTSGSALILYNLKDAIAELPSAFGLWVHRSYWVSKQYVDALQRQGRQGLIQLKSGELIPVSRGKLDEVTQALKASV